MGPHLLGSRLVFFFGSVVSVIPLFEGSEFSVVTAFVPSDYETKKLPETTIPTI